MKLKMFSEKVVDYGNQHEITINPVFTNTRMGVAFAGHMNVKRRVKAKKILRNAIFKYRGKR